MKDGIMGVNVIFLVIAAILASNALSCQSKNKYIETDAPTLRHKDYPATGNNPGPARSPAGSPEGVPDGRETAPPKLAETTELLLKIDAFLISDDPLLSITEKQEERLIPILREWKNTLDDDKRANTEVFVKKVSEQLRLTQREYLLFSGPHGESVAFQDGKNGPPQRPSPGAERPESGKPERSMRPLNDLELLNTILDKLS